MRALSIRQPYVEEILRGIKTVEYRSKPCRLIGERFYIYAALRPGDGSDIATRFKALGSEVGGLPTGSIVGTAIITSCTPPTKIMLYYHWHLAEVQRLETPLKPKKHPQPSWFNPF